MILHLLIADYLSCNPKVRSIHTERLLDTSARHFSAFLGREACVSDLTDKNLTAYIRYRRGLGKAPATVEREAAKLMSLWRYAASCGYVAPPRIVIEKIPPAEPVAFLKREVRALFREAYRYDSAIGGVPGDRLLTALLHVTFDTAERIGALCEVERHDIQLTKGWFWITGGWITIRSRKNGGRPMVRKLRRSTAKALSRHFEVCQHKKPFGHVHRGTLYYHLERLLIRAGLPTTRRHKFHCLRRSHASYLYAAGGNSQESLGHADANTTKRHYHDARITRTEHPIDRLFNPLGIYDRILALLGW
jgi:integrase